MVRLLSLVLLGCRYRNDGWNYSTWFSARHHRVRPVWILRFAAAENNFFIKPGRCIFGVCSPARPKLQPQTKKHSRGLSIFWLVWSFRALDFGYLDFGMILFLGFGRYWRYSSRIALKMLFTQFGEAGKLEKSVLTDPVDFYFRCHTEMMISPLTSW